MFQRGVQGHAVAVAGEARIECGVDHDLVRGLGFVVAAAGRHGRCTRGVDAGIGLGQLAEAVHPPVVGEPARGDARWWNRGIGVGGQALQWLE